MLLVFVLTFLGYMKFTNSTANQLGLNILGWVKNIKGETVDFTKLKDQDRPLVDHTSWSTLLASHVTPLGNVNYEGFVEEAAKLQEYLDQLSENPPGKNWSDNDELAYWINAYNAFTVKLIIDHYPLKSIKDIAGGLPMINTPWDIKFFKIGGIDFDLNTIEHNILRVEFEEPRIHFAVNCASFSCPKLKNEAYIGERVNEQLDEQAREFIFNADKNQVTASATKISKIFSWFEDDFNKKGSVLSFIKKYQPALDETNEIQYIDYIWTLNE